MIDLTCTFSCDIAPEGIRHQFSEAADDEVERQLREQMEVAP